MTDHQNSSAATEHDYLEDNIGTVAFHIGRDGARLTVADDSGPLLLVDPGEVLKEASRRLSTPAQPAPIYQVMATDDDEGAGKDVWIDVTKEVFDDLKQRNDVRYRILAASQPSPAATVEPTDLPDGWEYQKDTNSVVCGGCAFRYGAEHSDADGNWTCPNCGNGNGAAQRPAATVETFERPGWCPACSCTVECALDHSSADNVQAIVEALRGSLVFGSQHGCQVDGSDSEPDIYVNGHMNLTALAQAVMNAVPQAAPVPTSDELNAAIARINAAMNEDDSVSFADSDPVADVRVLLAAYKHMASSLTRPESK